MNTLFLATVMGWYLVIFGLFVFCKQAQLKLIATEILTQRGLFFVFALLTVILGLLLVASHNLWVMGWPVVITLLSWLVLISGLVRLFYPETAMKMARAFFDHPMRMKVNAAVFFLIGLFLLFKVYY
ncbi:MAG: hypothetical protein WC785_03280 [Tatlockia sp.]